MEGPLAHGVCQFCGITDAEIDGDKFRWLTWRRDVCSKFECQKALREKKGAERERIEKFNRKRNAELRAQWREQKERRGLLKRKRRTA